MKIIIISSFLSFSLSLSAQNKISGCYRDYFGNKIQLNPNNTFKFTWSFDLIASWTSGIWVLKNDTISFRMVPIYDTLKSINRNNIVTDSLILSDDEISERITPIQSISTAISAGGQNRKSYPLKLLFKNGRLYKIQEGILVVKKQKGLGSNKNWDPWYFKCND